LDVLTMLKNELALAMALSIRPTFQGIDHSILR
jgi:hypothetical protein